MPNPPLKSNNSRSFDPDKGLPLIAKRDCRVIGEGAAAKAEEEHQVYDKGKQVKQVVNPIQQKHHMKRKS